MKVDIAMTEANDEAKRMAVIAAAWDASDRAFEKARAARVKTKPRTSEPMKESRLLEFRDDQLRADNGRWITEKDIKDAVNNIGMASELLQSVEDPDKREIVAQALKDEGMTKDDYEKAVKGMGSAGDGGSGAIDALTLKDKLPLNDYGTPSGTLAIGPVKVKAYRTGDVTNNGQGGVFFSGDAEGAEEYRSLHNDEPVVGYEVELQNPILVGHQGDLTRKYFKKPYGEMMDSYQFKYGRKGADVATGKFDAALIAAVKKDGYDGIIYVAPAPPAKTEVVVFGKSEKDFARVKPMKASGSSGASKSDDYDAIAKSVEGAGGKKPDRQLPKPVSFKGESGVRYTEKMTTIYDAAQRGDIPAVEAVKTNATSKVHYVKTLHEYKQETLRLLGELESRGIEPPAKGVVLDPKVISKPVVATKGVTRNAQDAPIHSKTTFNYVDFPTSGVEEYEGQHEANKARLKSAKVYEDEVSRIYKEAPKTTPAKVNIYSSDMIINPQHGGEVHGTYNSSNNEIRMGLLRHKKDTAPLTIGSYKVDVGRAGIIRHELGHHVQYNLDINLRSEWLDIAKSVNPKDVSEYAGKKQTELFAESFSAFMHPDYKAGMLPPAIERFMKKATGKK